MPFIDDWKHVQPDEQRFLMETCQRETCNHARMMHCEIRRTRPSGGVIVSVTAHRCESCACREFATAKRISADDLIDAGLALERGRTLADFGIQALHDEPSPEAW